MMQAAKDAVSNTNSKPLLIAVTVLTSMSQEALAEVGIDTNLEKHVLKLAKLTEKAGLDGVVCSALETPLLRQQLNSDFCLVTPGIRPEDASKDDQTRVVTPKQALKNGSSYLVIGRPITQSSNPQQTLENIYLSCH
jgi:orotidine-5'-phosphate decarboxylase